MSITRLDAVQSFFIAVIDDNTGQVTRLAIPADTQIGVDGLQAELMLTGRFSLNVGDYTVFGSSSLNINSNDSIVSVNADLVQPASVLLYLPTNQRDGEVHFVKNDSLTTAGKSVPLTLATLDNSTIDGFVTTSLGTSSIGATNAVYWFRNAWHTFGGAGGGATAVVTGSGISGITVQSASINLPHNPYTTLNFTGSGITALDSGIPGVANIFVTGGITITQTGSNLGLVNPYTQVNFTGSGVSVSDLGGVAQIYIPGGGTGWTTALEIDFTNAGSHTFSSDGNYTVNGLQWTALNTGNASQFDITPGTGLTIKSGLFGGYGYGSTFLSSPYFRIPFNQIPLFNGKIDWSTRLRIWVSIGAGESNSGGGGAADCFEFWAIENLNVFPTQEPFFSSFERGNCTGGAGQFAYQLTFDGVQKIINQFVVNGGGTYNTFTNVDRTVVWDIANLLFPPIAGAYSAGIAPGAGFPTNSDNYKSIGFLASTVTTLWTGSNVDPTQFGFGFGIAGQSLVTVKSVIQRLKIEYFTGGGIGPQGVPGNQGPSGSFGVDWQNQGVALPNNPYVWANTGPKKGLNVYDSFLTATLDINDNYVATLTGSTFRGPVTSQASVGGFTGSLTQTGITGNPYLVGVGITINTNSLGQVLITGSAAVPSGTSVGLWIDGGGKIRTTGSVAIDGQGWFASNEGTDAYLWVSGNIGLTGAGANKAVFGGDVVESGSLVVLNGITGTISRTPQGNALIIPLFPGISVSTSSLGQIIIGNTKTGDDKASYVVIASTASLPNDRVLTAGAGIAITDGGPGGNITISNTGGGGGSNTVWIDLGNTAYTTSSISIDSQGHSAGQIGNNIYFWVSGTIGLTGSAGRIADFGGDVFVSGSVTSLGGFTGSLTKTVQGNPYIIGTGSVTVTTNSLGQILISGSGGGGSGGTTNNFFITGAAAIGQAAYYGYVTSSVWMNVANAWTAVTQSFPDLGTVTDVITSSILRNGSAFTFLNAGFYYLNATFNAYGSDAYITLRLSGSRGIALQRTTYRTTPTDQNNAVVDGIFSASVGDIWTLQYAMTGTTFAWTGSNLPDATAARTGEISIFMLPPATGIGAITVVETGSYAATDSNDVLWWPLHEVTGNVAYNNGTGGAAGHLTASATSVRFNQPGALRTSVGPNVGGLTTNNYLVTNNLVTPPFPTSSGTITLSAWCNPSSFPNTTNNKIVHKSYFAAQNSWNSPFDAVGMTMLSTNPGQGQVQYFAITSSAGVSYAFTTAISNSLGLNMWNHIGLTFDAPNLLMSCYLNGALMGTVTLNGTNDHIDISGNGWWAVGGNVAIPSSEYFPGYIEDVRCAGVVRPASWFQQVWLSGRPDAVVPFVHTASAPSGNGGVNVQMTGSALPKNPYTVLNFTGSAVNVSDVGGVATVNVVPSVVATYVDRPTPGNSGRMFFGTDTPVAHWVDDSTQWRPLILGQSMGYEPPLSSSFGNFNQGGATLTQLSGALQLLSANDGGSTINRGFSQVISTSSTTAFVEVAITFNPTPSNSSSEFTSLGVGLRETSTGKCYALEHVYFGNATGNTDFLQVVPFTSNTTFSGATSYPIPMYNGPMFLRVRRDASNVYAEWSRDRLHWVQVTSLALSTAFTTAPDAAVITARGVQGVAQGLVLHFKSGSL